jgi:hypothetical protein
MTVAVTDRPYHIPPPEQECFTWTFPGGPLRINVPLSLIGRLQAELDEHYRRCAGASPREVGGVLLGREGDFPDMIEIEDYLFVPSETADGRYGWSAAAFKEMSHAEDETRRVGYFRTEWGDSLTLRDEEIEAVQEHFPDRTNVALLIQSSPDERHAGFLFWDGDVFTSFSFMDFPFDAEVLKREASERDRYIQLLDQREEGDKSKETEVAREPAMDPAPNATAKKAARPANRGVWMPWATALGLTAGLAAWAFYYSRPHIASSPEPIEATDSAQLAVTTEPTGIDVRWNRLSEAVRKAGEGVLVVMDGDRPPQLVWLNREQLKIGHVFFEPVAGRTEFRLELSDESGHTVKESVIVLSSKTDAPVPRQRRSEAPRSEPFTSAPPTSEPSPSEPSK